MSNCTLQEDLKTVILMELCTPDLKEHLEFSTKELGYKETREAIMAYVERKRKDTSIAMDIGKVCTDYRNDYTDQWGSESYDQNDGNGDLTEINYYGY